MEPNPGARLSRFERAQKTERGKLWLMERDELLLTELFVHQVMSRGQLQELYFGSVPRCNARLRKLFDHGYVTRDFHPMAPYGTQGIYRIGPQAMTIVAQRLDMDAAYVKQLCLGTRRLEFLEHTLEIVDFYLAARNALVGEANPHLEAWMPELQVRHEYEVKLPSGKRQKQVFKPDGFLRFDHGGRLYSHFVEIDRGNASGKLFGQKVEHYQHYLSSGLFEEMYEDATFRILVVTTGERRLTHLRALVQERGGSVFWFTTRVLLTQEGLLAPIWQPADREGLFSLQNKDQG